MYEYKYLYKGQVWILYLIINGVVHVQYKCTVKTITVRK